ncbi:unnamed protein product, partial [marine sediment metagenome]
PDDVYDFQYLAYGKRADCIGLADHLRHTFEDEEGAKDEDLIEIL